jgi:hypothetical protein
MNTAESSPEQYDKETHRNKKSELYVYHDDVDNTYKVNPLARIYANRQREMLDLMVNEQSSWLEILRRRFGRVESTFTATDDVARIEYLESLLDKQIETKDDKKKFFQNLNYLKKDDKNRYSLITKPNEIVDYLNDIGYTIQVEAGRSRTVVYQVIKIG